uniref:Auxin response factor n=1 Tax=Rhizophora mucronata TaxID=61149 RepID=A0A2P2MGL4_RHIMU
MSGLRGVGTDSDSTTIPFSCPNYMSAIGTEFSLNPAMTPSSCIDESGFLQSPENADQVNPPTGTFVKVSCLVFLTNVQTCFTLVGLHKECILISIVPFIFCDLSYLFICCPYR